MIYIGARALAGLRLGTREVCRAYIGTRLAWEKDAGVFVYFDNGYANGVAWRGNALTRPSYTAYGSYNLSHVADGGYMQMHINNGGSTYTHYACLSTQDLISIPKKAARLRVIAKYESASGQFRFGLLPANAPNCVSTANGGVLSSYVMPPFAKTEYSIAVPEDMRGSAAYRLALTFRGVADRARISRVFKVWFTEE